MLLLVAFCNTVYACDLQAREAARRVCIFFGKQLWKEAFHVRLLLGGSDHWVLITSFSRKQEAVFRLLLGLSVKPLIRELEAICVCVCVCVCVSVQTAWWKRATSAVTSKGRHVAHLLWFYSASDSHWLQCCFCNAERKERRARERDQKWRLIITFTNCVYVARVWYSAVTSGHELWGFAKGIWCLKQDMSHQKKVKTKRWFVLNICASPGFSNVSNPQK